MDLKPGFSGPAWVHKNQQMQKTEIGMKVPHGKGNR